MKVAAFWEKPENFCSNFGKILEIISLKMLAKIRKKFSNFKRKMISENGAKE